ncbi:MAG: putative dehydrogenase [Kiritimatiellia bacterium]|jgi:predicted dehydrogenase
MIKVGVIGYGYWGPNLVRNFHEYAETSVTMVCDLNQALLEQVRVRYPTIAITQSLDELLAHPEIDAIAVATPISTHYDLAMKVIEAGKHVLVEKPLAHSVECCDKLIAAAAAKGVVLMVDHTFPFTPAVQRIKKLIDEGAIGDVLYYDSVRVNLGLFQHDVNVIWDLAVHDLSILEYILDEKPTMVSATGISHVEGQPENQAYITLYYEARLIAHIHVNWLAPLKVRQTLIGGTEKMIVYDDTENTEKVKVYDKGITTDQSPESVYQMRVGYRAGDMWAPHLEYGEALRNLVADFVECIRTGKTPLTDAESGRRIVRVMEAASLSVKENGRPVVL